MGLVDSDDEEDILSSAQKPARTATTTTRPVAPVKRGVNATITTTNNRAAEKPAQSTTRSTRSNSIAPATRKALAEKPSNATEKTEKTMAGRGRKRAAPEEAPPPPVRSNRRDENNNNNNTTKGARGRPRAAKVQKLAEVEDEEEAPETQPEPVVAKPPPARRGRKPKAKIDTPPAEREVPETQEPEPEIPETQHVDPTDVSIDEEEQAEESESEPEPEPPARKRNGVSSVQRPSHRAVATSDAEPNDPSARKRVGDLTRKYQELEAKYRDLREIGVLEAERNYDKLKQQSEEKAKSKQEPGISTPLTPYLNTDCLTDLFLLFSLSCQRPNRCAESPARRPDGARQGIEAPETAARGQPKQGRRITRAAFRGEQRPDGIQDRDQGALHQAGRRAVRRDRQYQGPGQRRQGRQQRRRKPAAAR